MRTIKFLMLLALFAFSPMAVFAQEVDINTEVLEPDIGAEIASVETTNTYYNHFQETPIEEPTEVVEPGLNEFLEVSWKLVLTILITSLLLSGKHIVANTFSFKIWWHDSYKPVVITFFIAIALLAIDMFLKSIDTIVESTLGIATDYNDHTTIAAAAVILLPLIKGWFERDETKEKVAVKKALKD